LSGKLDFDGANGMSDIEDKAAQVAAREHDAIQNPVLTVEHALVLAGLSLASFVRHSLHCGVVPSQAVLQPVERRSKNNV
jgi:hypothetical protein